MSRGEGRTFLRRARKIAVFDLLSLRRRALVGRCSATAWVGASTYSTPLRSTGWGGPSTSAGSSGGTTRGRRRTASSLVRICTTEEHTSVNLAFAPVTVCRWLLSLASLPCLPSRPFGFGRKMASLTRRSQEQSVDSRG